MENEKYDKTETRASSEAGVPSLQSYDITGVGRALIINNETFTSSSLPDLPHSKVEADGIQDVLERLGFKVERHDNQTRRNMLEIIDNLSQYGFTDCWCFFCIILSHGTRDNRVYGTDDHLDLGENIMKPFIGNSCPPLIGKPKIFLIEACRGDQKEEVANISISERPVSRCSMGSPAVRIPNSADILLCHPTSEGSVAYMGQFLTKLTNMMKRCILLKQPDDPAYSFSDILTLVKEEVARSEIEEKQMPTTMNSLRKRIMFNVYQPLPTEQDDVQKLPVPVPAVVAPTPRSVDVKYFSKTKALWKKNPVWILQFRLGYGRCKVLNGNGTEICRETVKVAFLPLIGQTYTLVNKIEFLFKHGYLFAAKPLIDEGWAYHCTVNLIAKLPPSKSDADIEKLAQEVNAIELEYVEQHGEIDLNELLQQSSSGDKCNSPTSKNKLATQVPTYSLPKAQVQGSQPKGGKMEWVVERFHLAGYKCNTIVITYTFSGGTQVKSHPSPSSPYNGCTENAYLPDNDEGKTIYRLLRKAFDQGLTFGIGMSPNTHQYTVMFKDIPHKTQLKGGAVKGGYPDKNYIKAVAAALSKHGIKN